MLVTPYLKQWAPPAFSPKFPAIVVTFSLDGSGLVEITVLGQRLLQIQRDRPRLDHDPLILDIDLENPIHPRQDEGRCRPAWATLPPLRFVPAPRAMTGIPFVMGKFDHLRHLLRGGGNHDAVGPSPGSATHRIRKAG